jgi:hypothetical protein
MYFISNCWKTFIKNIFSKSNLEISGSLLFRKFVRKIFFQMLEGQSEYVNTNMWCYIGLISYVNCIRMFKEILLLEVYLHDVKRTNHRYMTNNRWDRGWGLRRLSPIWLILGCMHRRLVFQKPSVLLSAMHSRVCCWFSAAPLVFWFSSLTAESELADFVCYVWEDYNLHILCDLFLLYSVCCLIDKLTVFFHLKNIDKKKKKKQISVLFSFQKQIQENKQLIGF